MRNEAERLIMKGEMHKNTERKKASHVCANHEALEERRSNARGYGRGGGGGGGGGEEEENERGTRRGEAEEENTKASSKA